LVLAANQSPTVVKSAGEYLERAGIEKVHICRNHKIKKNTFSSSPNKSPPNRQPMCAKITRLHI
jgi:hypothetical protein